MQFELRHIDSLIEDPENLRLHPEDNIKAIQASIRRYGQQRPILIDKGSVIIAGNGYVRALRGVSPDDIKDEYQHLKEGKVWVSISNLESDKDKLEYGVVDNRSGELSEWNYERLSATFTKFIEADEWTLEDTKDLGWKPSELEPLLNAEWTIDDDEDEDYDPAEDSDYEDAHPERTEFRLLVKEVIKRVREREGDQGIDERDCLAICYREFLA